MADFSNRIAIVTGANKGIGFGICKLLRAKGVAVVLTARDEKRGLEAVRKLEEEEDTSGVITFHQLDVTDASSISALVGFIEANFGKLDILVNNAGVPGATVDVDALRSSSFGQGEEVDWSKIATESYEQTEDCLNINYYGAKRIIGAFLPLLHLSESPRIVNVSSSMGRLMYLPDSWAKGVLSTGEDITEEKVEEIARDYLKDYKAGMWESKGWPKGMSAYIVSKAVLNGYTRAIAKKHRDLRINCVCPGFVKTDMNHNTGLLSIEEGAEGPVMLALLPDDGPTGTFFIRTEVGTFD